MDRLAKVMDKYSSEAKKNVLNLVVSKQWFDMIVAGEKTEEYRAIKSYWINRLLQAKYGGSDEYRKVTMHQEFDMLISNSKLKELLEKKTARFIPYTYVRFFHGYAKNVRGLRRRLSVSALVNQRRACVPTSGLILSFL